MEIYLEGHVVFRQDEREVAGNGDQKTYHAETRLLQRPVRTGSSPSTPSSTCSPPAWSRRPRCSRPGSSSSVPWAGADGGMIVRARGDPRRPDRDDRQPVPQPRLPLHQPLGRHPSRRQPKTDPNYGPDRRAIPATPKPAGPDLADRRPAELLLPRPGPRLLLAADPGQRRRPRPPDPADPSSATTTTSGSRSSPTGTGSSSSA